MPFTGHDHWNMLRLYAINNENLNATVAEYRRLYPNRTTPNPRTILNTLQRLLDGGLIPARRRNAGVSRISLAAEDAILSNIVNNPRTSTREIARQVGVSQSAVMNTLHRESFHPYHFIRVQGLETRDYPARLQFCQWALSKHQRNPGFSKNILWTDECCFTRGGCFNTHNEHLWARENPHAMREYRFQTRYSVNVWIGLIDNILLGPHIFPRTLNGVLYLDFLENTLPDMIDEEVPLARIGNMYYMHDGAPPHAAVQVRNYLNHVYPNKWIGRGGPVTWPARSPDLNPLDYFLWGYMKSEVYKTPVRSINDLQARIFNVADQIKNDPEMIRRSTTDGFIRRVELCNVKSGGHFQAFL